ncbi:MAG: tetratricopeptide repeat protein [Candidatus Hydrogenedentes bacterium]|nr:tetratricopeptide repeat protein [Candidatus Hydrogenedentota bacterium]
MAASERKNHWIALCALALVLHGAASAAPAIETLQQMATRASEAPAVADASLIACQGLRPDLDVRKYTAQMDALASELKPRLLSAPDPQAKLRVMAEAIYGKWGFAAQAVLPPTVFTGLDDVLDKRHWNCFGMTLLYLGLGERLGLPLRMVSGRGHAFVEWNAPAPLYIETTQQGRAYGNKDYLKSYLPFPCVDPNDYAALDARQAIAVITVQIALTLQDKGQYPQAAAYYDCALRFDPKQAEAQTGIGIIALAQHKPGDAITAFRKALAISSAFREAYGGLGEALHANGDTDGALDVYRKLLGLCAAEPKAQFNLGQLLYEKNDLDGAIAAYQKYIALLPNDPDGYARLAFPLEDKGDLDGALAAYKKALSLNPNYIDAYVNMGHLIEKRNDAKGAENAYRSALALQSNHPLALSGLGRALALQGRIEEALKHLQRASELAPADAGVWIDYGNVTRKTGESARAIGMYRRAIECDPTDSEAYLALAETQRDAGAMNDAKVSAEKARALGAKLPPALEALVNPVPAPGAAPKK